MKIERSLVLLQPWAYDIVEGKMKMLIRSFKTNIRGRVGIYITRNIDRVWLWDEKRKPEDYRSISKKSMIIGSVNIEDVVIVNSPNEAERFIQIHLGKKYLDYYPKHMIPDAPNKPLYIWIFSETKKFKEPVTVDKRSGMQWCKYEFDDSE